MREQTPIPHFAALEREKSIKLLMDISQFILGSTLTLL